MGHATRNRFVRHQAPGDSPPWVTPPCKLWNMTGAGGGARADVGRGRSAGASQCTDNSTLELTRALCSGKHMQIGNISHQSNAQFYMQHTHIHTLTLTNTNKTKKYENEELVGIQVTRVYLSMPINLPFDSTQVVDPDLFARDACQELRCSCTFWD